MRASRAWAAAVVRARARVGAHSPMQRERPRPKRRTAAGSRGPRSSERTAYGPNHSKQQHYRPAPKLFGMCRNIRTLYNFEPPATDEEVRASALQYVRKISGFTKPSRANEEAFARAVDEVADASKRLLDQLVTSAAPKDREVEAERARARAGKRFAAA